MFFNPLFISNANTNNSIDGVRENKFTNSNYLFADIINVSTEKLALNSTTNIELESKNKALFKNFENLTYGTENKETSANNDYLGDDTAVAAFLSSVLNQIETVKNSSGQIVKADKTQLNQETLKAIFESISSGEKFSVPIKNNGKEIIAEIQKFSALLQNADTTKVVKLSQSSNNNSAEIDYNLIISNILSSLKETFSSNEFNMSDEKISQLISKIETNFSKLVSLNNETFKPQKNILSSLITEVQKELNLSTKESDILKKTIVDEFVKVINPEIKAESTQPGSAIQEKQIGFPMLSNKLELTPKEIKLLEGIEIEKLTLPELNNKLKTLLSNPSQSAEVKSLLSKVDSYLKSNSEVVTSSNVTSKFTLPKLSEVLNLTPKETEIVKNINSEKLTLPELSDKLKALISDSSKSSEAKSLLSKVDSYLKSNSEVKTSEAISSKFTLPKISEVLNLTLKEITVVKSLVSEKISLPEFNNELKALENFSKSNIEIKSVLNKIETILSPKNIVTPEAKTDEKLSLLDLSKKLKLTSGEIEAVQKESFKKVNIPELKEVVKEKISKAPTNTELKTLFAKLEKLEVKTTSLENVKLNEKFEVVSNRKLNNESNFVEKVKSGIKNVFTNKEVVDSSNNVEKEKYLITLKTEKSPESLTLKDDIFVKKTKPELLNKTVYASKESVDLTKLKVVPLNEDASRESKAAQDKDTKLTKVSNDKDGFVETKISKSENKNSSSNMGNRESSNNRQGAAAQVTDDAELTTDSLKLKPFEKMINKNLEADNKNVVIKENKIESNILHKKDSSEVKVEEPNFSKFAAAHNQIFKSDLRVNQKNIYKRIDIKNLNQELTQLIQKGEKKIIQFQLTPENLGKLNIRLEVINKVISASIKVDNEATQQLVQNSLENLKATLNQNGVQYNSLNVSLSNSEDKNQRFFKQKRKNNNAAKMNVEGFDETFVRKNLGYNKYDFIA
ncbi:MAG: flagellar hook-length control protein FliK [Melioribacteraceae bacterium]|nr:flagellar hook-length control protein FliK [Melioribacteraceae bacterium]